MARRSRKRDHGSRHVPLDVEAVTRGWARTEGAADGSQWTVRQVAGSDKAYRCPGCRQLLAPGTAHVVVWPAEHLLGDRAALEDRRHWHASCWRRARRTGPSRV